MANVRKRYSAEEKAQLTAEIKRVFDEEKSRAGSIRVEQVSQSAKLV